MTLRFVLALHSHLPWVLHHGRWPHGSDWLSEATLDCYLPLIAMLDQLEDEGAAPALTLGVTPILAAQLAEPAFRDEVDLYFAHRREAIEAAPASLRATGDTQLLPLVDFWRQHLRWLEGTWESIDRDLIAALRRHVEAGSIEVISSAATHGFLPLLARDESIRLQLLVGRAEHARHFGNLPRGCWVPECAYRPSGPWQPLAEAPASAMRPGLEDHLRYAGFQWFFVDAHVVDAGESYDLYGGAPRPRPRRRRSHRSALRAYQVGLAARGRPIMVLVRDPTTTAQVWSRTGGYPGDARYLEFHKIRFPGGLRYWAVTDPAADLALKEPYHPAAARQAAASHARHFQSLLNAVAHGAAARDRIIAAPFDTELFGHWWFEGVDFLRYLFESLETGSVHAATAGRALAEAPPATALRLGSGSWGKDGDFSMWLNPGTEWTWRRIWPLEVRFWNAVPAALRRWNARQVVEQAARELLLAQSSDWQFIISTAAAADYATKRFVEHCDALESLLPYLEHDGADLATANARAAELAAIDGPFPDLLGAVAAASDVPRT